MKILAIDFGTKRIGIAVGDTELGIASPKGTLSNRGDILRDIAYLVEETGAERIVVGMPFTPSGKEGQRAKLVREFVQNLKEKLPSTEIVLWDERYTTLEAQERLSHLPPKKRKEVIDSVSAQIILEEYLRSL